MGGSNSTELWFESLYLLTLLSRWHGWFKLHGLKACACSLCSLGGMGGSNSTELWFESLCLLSLGGMGASNSTELWFESLCLLTLAL
jgi:hypothetical protein